MATARKHKTRDIERAVLPNGVRVVTEQMAHVRSVTVGIWIGTGSREETPEESGLTHFIEHMVFKGTKNRSAEQIARSVDSIGGGLDAFTSKELVSYNVKVLDEHLPEAFDVVTDLVRNPLFAHDDIEKEKGVILEELKMEVDNPEYLIHEIFSSNFWKGHALGRPILGTKADHPHLRSREGRKVLQAVLHAVEHPDHRGRKSEPPQAGQAGRRKFRRSKAAQDASARRDPPQPHAPLVFRNKNSLEQVHLVPGRPVDLDAARKALRVLHPERDSRRRHEFAPVPEHPRKAGPRLHRLFRTDHVSRRGLHAGLRRDLAENRRQSDRIRGP